DVLHHTLHVVLFFFHSAGHLRAPHSFPTRRSSDLGHEMSGTVDADPSGTFAPGTPVTVHPATFGETLPYLADAPHLWPNGAYLRSEEHTSELQSRFDLVCRLLLEKKN